MLRRTKIWELNCLMLAVGLVGVWYCAESWWAIFWTFVAAIHFGDSKAEQRADNTTLGEIYDRGKEEQRAKQVRSNVRKSEVER